MTGAASPAPDGLDEVADALYALRPGEFTVARNARAKKAKAGGDRELAAAITALGKPTRVAWLANQLVRRRGDEVQPLLDLGAGLREATASLSGEQLRALNTQQGKLIHALVQQARAIAAEAGEPVSDDVAEGLDQTLRAALADETLAAALASGRLTDKLEFAGFGGSGSGGGGAVTIPPRRLSSVGAAAARRTVAKDDGEEQRRRAEQRAAAQAAVDRAREAEQAAAQEAERAQQGVSTAEAAVEAAAAHVAALQEQLAEATVAHGRAEHDARQAKEALRRSERAARHAVTARETAERALADLPAPSSAT